MNQRHYRCVAVKQVIVLYLVALLQDKVPGDDAIASDFSVSKEAKQRHPGEELPECVGLHIPLGSVVLEAPAHAGEHEAHGVALGDAGCFEALHRRLGCLLVTDVFVEEHGGALDPRAAERQPDHPGGINVQRVPGTVK